MGLRPRCLDSPEACHAVRRFAIHPPALPAGTVQQFGVLTADTHHCGYSEITLALCLLARVRRLIPGVDCSQNPKPIIDLIPLMRRWGFALREAIVSLSPAFR